jgi:hypothetical protein
VVSEPAVLDDLFDRADDARAAGRRDEAARLYDECATRCRALDDLEGWTRAVLGSASVYVFGAQPGKLPAQLHDVLVRTTRDEPRARVAAALARCWAYAGQPARAVPFADEAVTRAERVGAPALIADCLDAALAAHWGPDDLEARRALAARLDEVAAHVVEPEARLQAHLWGLQVACEVLDLQTMHRQLRALELLGDESPRALFFAASRRLMLDLLRGRTDTTAQLVEVATVAAERADLADAWMVLEAMGSYAAAVSGDRARCAAGAARAEDFALAQGFTAVSAEAAFLWACAGELGRAGALVHTFHPPVLEELPRDVNWLMTLQCVLEAALAVRDEVVTADATRLLTPYAGRAVVNAGAVMFHGVTDDTLSRAVALADPETASQLRARALATYERIGAQWWRNRLLASAPEPPSEKVRSRRAHLRRLPSGLWEIGTEPATAVVPDLRGLAHLRDLVRRPGEPVPALDLVAAGQPVLLEGGLGEAADRQALAAYRARLVALDEELAEAEDWADAGRIAAARAERDSLLDEIARATGLHGRPRTGGSSQERARIAVRKAITTALDRVAASDPEFAEHLRASVHTGLSCSYDPAPGSNVEWVVD